MKQKETSLLIYKNLLQKCFVQKPCLFAKGKEIKIKLEDFVLEHSTEFIFSLTFQLESLICGNFHAIYQRGSACNMSELGHKFCHCCEQPVQPISTQQNQTGNSA